MNDTGVAVGAFRWLSPFPCTWSQGGGVIPIPVPAGVLSAEAIRINNNGWILASAQTATGAKRGFVLVPNGTDWTWIEMLPASPTGWSYVSGINDNNEVVGAESIGSEQSALYPFGGYAWSPERKKVSIQVVGWNATQCIDINNSGIICGNVSQLGDASAATDGTRGFVLDDGVLTIIEPPSPWWRSELRRINSNNLVAGNVYSQSQGSQTTSSGLLFDMGAGTVSIIPTPKDYFRWIARDLADCGLMCGSLVRFPKPFAPLLCAATIEGVTDLTTKVPEKYSTIAADGTCIRNDGVIVATCECYDALLCYPVNSGGDFDCDGLVGASDLAELLSAWGQCSATADIDGDGAVGGSDIGALLANWSVYQ